RRAGARPRCSRTTRSVSASPRGGRARGAHPGPGPRQSRPILPPNACSTGPLLPGSRYFVSVAEEIAIPGAGRNLKDILRYVAGLAAGVVVLLLLFGKRAEFTAAWNQLGGVTPGWPASPAPAARRGPP